MLELRNIKKTYVTGDLTQDALKGVSLSFRESEFVAILGHSGSGKTTLLNIIGGLDEYTSGDLIINGISTKKYKNRDWDAYRNNTIGFIFQSYNLIPHQTVLANVELALTLKGISKNERKERAIKALTEVGLGDHIYKKPTQMSGGQMQRVAIARALINNPDIILADEPTGALDTDTSLQVMNILKNIAKDKLVIMVTHNPELAEEYANRTIRLMDGEITGDSNPYTEESVIDESKRIKRNRRMSAFTAFSLSLNNLMTKKLRTFMTAFAGSIGIMGIALILALSTGFQNYIDDIQEETMSSYPLTIQKETSNVFGALLSARIEGNKDIEEGKVKEQMMISSMMNSVGSNDLTSFKKWLEKNEHLYKDDIKNISYSYSVSPRIFTRDVTGAYVQLNPNTIMSSIYSDGVMSMMSSFSAGSSVGTFSSYDFEKLPDNTELLLGNYPKNYDEVMIVLSEKGKIADLLVYSLGLRDNKELRTLIADVMAGEESDIKNEPLILTYEELMAIELKLINVTDLYKYNDKYNTYEYMVDDDDFMSDVFKKSETLKITGIAVSNEDSNLAGVVYSKDLVGHVIDVAKDSPIVKKQLSNREVDVFSGNRFDEKEERSSLDFNDMVSVDEEMLKNAFKVNGDLDAIGNEELIKKAVVDNSNEAAKLISDTTAQMAGGLGKAYAGIAGPVVDGFDVVLEATKVRKPMDGPVTDEQGKPLRDLSSYSNEFLYITKADFNSFITQYAMMLPEGAAEGLNTLLVMLPDEIFLNDLVEIMTMAGTDESMVNMMIQGFKAYNPIDPNSYPLAKACDKSATYYSIDMASAMYKEQALSDEAISAIAEGINGASAEFSINKDNLKKITNEAFDKYLEVLKESDNYADGFLLMSINEAGVETPVTVLPDAETKEAIINNTVSDNSLLIFKEAYDVVSEMTPLLVMSGVGNALGEVMTPITDLFNNKDGFMSVDTDAFAKAFNFDMDENEVSRLMSSMMSGSSASYSNNLINLGFQDEDDPTSISLFFNDFDSKENFLELLGYYNDNVDDEDKQIQYTDITGMLISSVQTIINAVTYALIAFVAISLIVSSIMIGVITLISVMERTKEIGILRAIGASKKDISLVFNAETFIIGLLSGLIGIGVTLILLVPINVVLHKLTDIQTLNAVLPTESSVILVIISVVLTLIAGLIPSSSAAKKNPVEALRVE